MTQYPELMEILSENINPLYNEISNILHRWQRENEQYEDKMSSFMGNDIFNLVTKESPSPDDQGAYSYQDLLTFYFKFREIMIKFYDEDMEESIKDGTGKNQAMKWRNIYRFPEEEHGEVW